MNESVFEVDDWTVLMAIRYGMGRQTFANMDASNLAKRFWHKLPRKFQASIKEDVESLSRETWLPQDIVREWDWVKEK
jgi:hypothetical protein